MSDTQTAWVSTRGRGFGCQINVFMNLLSKTQGRNMKRKRAILHWDVTRVGKGMEDILLTKTSLQ